MTYKILGFQTVSITEEEYLSGTNKNKNLEDGLLF